MKAQNLAAVMGLAAVAAVFAGEPQGDFHDSVSAYRRQGRVEDFERARSFAESAVSRGNASPRDLAALMEFADYLPADPGARYRAFAAGRLAGSDGDDTFLAEARQRYRRYGERMKALAETVAKLPAKPFLGEKLKGSRKIVAKAEKLLGEPAVEPSDRAYLRFTGDGNRTEYQKQYFAFRERMTVFAEAETFEGKGRFLKAVEESMLAVVKMKSWVLPAHDGGKDRLCNFRGEIYSADLVSTETAARLAVILENLGSRLDPSVTRFVREETERRHFGPVRRSLLNCPYWTADGKWGASDNFLWWITTRMNWNSVCWNWTVQSALYFLDDPADRALFIASAVKAIDPYLEGGFFEDGVCTEGYGYCEYGFMNHLRMGIALRRATAGKLDVFTRPRQRRAAEYVYRATLPNGFVPAFSDCGTKKEISKGFREAIATVWPDLTRASTAPVEDFPEACLWIFRDPDGLSVAFHGGNNGAPHNHNDLGSYSIVKGGEYVSGDCGGEEYTRFTFSKEHRYESKVLNSYGHPVPVVGGRLQGTGKNFVSNPLEKELDPARPRVTLDLTGAYDCPTLGSLVRTFAYDRGAKRLTVTDRVEFTGPTEFEDAYNTYETRYRPKVRVTGADFTTIEEKIPNPNRLSPVRVGIRLSRPVTAATVEFVYE